MLPFDPQQKVLHVPFPMESHVAPACISSMKGLCDLAGRWHALLTLWLVLLLVFGVPFLLKTGLVRSHGSYSFCDQTSDSIIRPASLPHQ